MQQKIWQLDALSIRRIVVGELDNNVYLLTARNSGAQVLIDAADDTAAIIELLDSAKADVAADIDTQLVAVVTTHSHPDHHRALAEMIEKTGATTVAGSLDAAAIPVPIDVPVEHGDRGDFDGFSLEAIHLRGHTPGSIALLYQAPGGPAQLFSGDSLFPGGVGNTQRDPERFAQLFGDVCERIFDRLPDDTVVHPGHGKETTLGAERPALADWQARGW
ncbi:MBL fold metallo-hydrolase [Psychromicrobium lacuslunae]|uniref:Zn-dependent hydrolase n=1 Tax=Psychromicrobium lacuslunae TaxID=1618207 RepID=A0A0D4BX01_9MICC|nr:MBL fold metallo-hydrolase [Psychromicrobium lacuslunae]AJT40849.1 Zn-dependent hydrolase [Psychromicrobium lacuslunae]